MNNSSMNKMLALIVITLLAGAAYFLVIKGSTDTGVMSTETMAIDSATLANLVNTSEAVVLGKVESVSKPKVLFRDPQATADFVVYREAKIKAKTWYKKSNGIMNEFVLTLPGGEVVSSDTRLINDVTAKVTVGEEAVLFINKVQFFDEYDHLITNGYWEGIFHIKDGVGQSAEPTNNEVMEVLTKDQIAGLGKLAPKGTN